MIYTDANWEPLRAALGATCEPGKCDDPGHCPLDAWMWMYRDGAIEAYKNRTSRQYLYLESTHCGCTRDAMAGRIAAKCELHRLGSFACCLQAERLSCACFEAYRCQEHGEQHIGSHD